VGLVGAALPQVRTLFAAGRYDDAREALAASEEDDPDRLHWGRLLAGDPARAGELALAVVRDRDAPAARRIAAGLDGAALALARLEPADAWQALEPLLALPDGALPGEFYVLAGRTQQLAGNPQRAREMLASVGPADPAFAAARELLGRIGLQQRDRELALRYFESATRHVAPAARPDLLAGQWHALRLLGRDVEAREVAATLAREHPTSLATLEVREGQRRAQEELAALADTTDTAAPQALPGEETGRYSVQLAAFRDRALALQFVSRWRPEIPDLQVVAAADDLGQPLYRVQTGRFVSRAQAQRELDRLTRRHGLEGFVAGSVD
jgi:cell division septation protein DedD